MRGLLATNQERNESKRLRSAAIEVRVRGEKETLDKRLENCLLSRRHSCSSQSPQDLFVKSASPEKVKSNPSSAGQQPIIEMIGTS